MLYRHVVAAVNERDTPEEVASTGRVLAARSGARFGLLTVTLRATSGVSAQKDLRSSLEESGTHAVVAGVPGIEIPRFAEDNDVDLLVLGRTPRTPAARRLVGDTADAVTRRSRVPCLLLPPGAELFGPILAAVDGGRHSAAVLDAACRLARVTGSSVTATTVERNRTDEISSDDGLVPLARTVELRQVIATVAQAWRRTIHLELRRGDIVTELLSAAAEQGARVLVLGCPRGGPPAVMEGGSTARRLAHAAAIAVLTVPH